MAYTPPAYTSMMSSVYSALIIYANLPNPNPKPIPAPNLGPAAPRGWPRQVASIDHSQHSLWVWALPRRHRPYAPIPPMPLSQITGSHPYPRLQGYGQG